jgi:tetratricopeptide (TPR) repeat protein
MIEMYPDRSVPHGYLGLIYVAKGMYAEAIAAHQQTIKIGGDNTSDQIFLGAAYAKSGEHSKAKAILRRLETTKELVSPTELAVLYAALDETEKAFASLERAYGSRDYQLQFLGSPEFDSLRSDPRFADLTRRIGLPQS